MAFRSSDRVFVCRTCAVCCRRAPVTGRHDVFLVLTNPKKGGGLMNIDWVQFDR